MTTPGRAPLEPPQEMERMFGRQDASAADPGRAAAPRTNGRAADGAMRGRYLEDGATGTDRTDTRRTVVDGVVFVHERRCGPSATGLPPVLLQHFPAPTEVGDPAAPSPALGGREIILVEHVPRATGAGSGGADLHELARECLEFIDALGLGAADLLGFSLGVRPPEDVVLLSSPIVARLVADSLDARPTPHGPPPRVTVGCRASAPRPMPT